jgi:glycosyltransferase involved in cell wall biosynthesis
MKIAFYIPVLNIGGAEKVIINLLKELSFSNENEYFLITDVPNSKWIFNIEKNIKLINISSHSNIFIRLLRIVKEIKNHDLEMLVSHLTHSNIQCILLKYFIHFKLVIVEHSITSYYIKNIHYLKRLILNILIKVFFRKADQIVCVSEATKTDLLISFNIPAEKCNVIYNPIDFNYIEELSLKEMHKSVFQKINNRRFIVSIGRLEPYKNHLFLIETLKDYLIYHDLVLVIVGDGTQRMKLENRITELGLTNLVFLTGYETNPYPFILQSNVLVHPAKFEGFGLVLIEALYLGKPVISMNFTTAFEILNHGEFGFIVEDGASIIEALKFILESKSEHNFPNKRLNIYNKYNFKEITSQYSKLFKSTMDNSKFIY